MKIALFVPFAAIVSLLSKSQLSPLKINLHCINPPVHVNCLTQSDHCSVEPSINSPVAVALQGSPWKGLSHGFRWRRKDVVAIAHNLWFVSDDNFLIHNPTKQNKWPFLTIRKMNTLNHEQGQTQTLLRLAHRASPIGHPNVFIYPWSTKYAATIPPRQDTSSLSSFHFGSHLRGKSATLPLQCCGPILDLTSPDCDRRLGLPC